MNIICDLDGTIALDHKRSKWLHTPKCPKWSDNNHIVCTCAAKDRNWDAYFDACDTDDPNVGVIKLLSMLDGFVEVYVLSGRSQSTIYKTLDWLTKHKVRYNYLQMRAPDDRTQDDVLKLRWAKDFGLTPVNTLFVLEDRQRVVDMWRREGYRCFQVAPGNF